MKKFFTSLYKAIYRTVDYDGVEHAGYMSFMVLLSLFPSIVFFLAFTSAVGASESGDQFIHILLDNLPSSATESIQERIYELSQTPPPQLMTLAIVGTIWTASAFVEGLRTILNRMYEVSTPPAYIWRRLLSIVQFLAISTILSLVMTALVITPIILNKVPEIQELIDKLDPVWNYVRYSMIVISLFFSVSSLYYMIPNIKIRFIDVIPGAIITVITWIAVGYFMSQYIIYYTQLSVIYGSLGNIILTLLFFYVINILFIYGAAFNFLFVGERENIC